LCAIVEFTQRKRKRCAIFFSNADDGTANEIYFLFLSLIDEAFNQSDGIARLIYVMNLIKKIQSLIVHACMVENEPQLPKHGMLFSR